MTFFDGSYFIKGQQPADICGGEQSDCNLLLYQTTMDVFGKFQWGQLPGCPPLGCGLD